MSDVRRRWHVSLAILIGILIFVAFVVALVSFNDAVQANGPGFAFNAWQGAEPMLTARNWLGVVVLSDTLYAVGGWNGQLGGAQSAVERYDPQAGLWITRTNMPTARNALGLAALDGQLFALGGFDGQALTVTAVVEVYHPLTDTWTMGEPLPKARNTLAAVTLDGKIYAIGGWNGVPLTDVAVYDPGGSWTALAPLPEPRDAPAAVAFDGKIYVFGGITCTDCGTPSSVYTITNTAIVYDPDLNSWTPVASMAMPRWIAGAAAVRDKIYVVGGAGFPDVTYPWGQPIAGCEEYDPGAGTWRFVSSLPTARSGIGVGVIQDRLYAVGGTSEIGDVATNEVYSPPATDFIYLPSLSR